MSVKFNYQQTMQQAQALEQLASELGGMTKQKVVSVRTDLSAAWTGNSGKSFIKFMSDAEADLDAKTKYLRSIADYLKKSAKKMKDAEDAAKASASGIS